jgi:uncharacterized caspase-like protein
MRVCCEVVVLPAQLQAGCVTTAVRRRSPLAVLVLLLWVPLWLCVCSQCLAIDETRTTKGVVKVELAKMKAVKPFDRDVHLGFFVPPDLATQDPAEYGIMHFPNIFTKKDVNGLSDRSFENYSYTRLDYFDWTRPGLALVHELRIDLSTAFSTRLGELVRALFPAAVSTASLEPSAAFDMLLRAGMSASWQENPDHSPHGLEVRVELTILDAAGKSLEVIDGIGSAVPIQRHWTAKKWYADLGGMALQRAFDDLEGKLHSSPALAGELRRLAEARALPADLEATAEFDDRDSLLPNGRLDAGEQGRLIVRIANRGPGTAYGVTIRAAADRPHISVSGNGQIGDLAAGEQRQATLAIAGSLDLPGGVFGVRIDAADKRGYGGRPMLLQLTAGALALPHLEIIDVALNDGTGRAHGDGDGQPANGETIEAIVRIRNDGPGEAAGTAVTVTSSVVGVELREPRVVLAHITAPGVQEARLLFSLPVTFASPKLSLTFEATDARGAKVGQASRTETWHVRAKRPAIAVTYHIYDGNSIGSTGNRDGQVNNGERIEVALRAANHGEISGRGVQLEIGSEDPLLVPRPATMRLGDLPPHAEAPEQRFVIDVPHAYGRERSMGDIPLILTIGQDDFPPTRVPIALPFRFTKPDLLLDVASPERIARGVASELSLQARNQGELAAEEVSLEVTCESAGIELLDERGSPSGSRHFVLGALAPLTASSLLHLRLLPRQTAPGGPAMLKISLSQRDFPPANRVVRLEVGDAAPTVISAQKPMAPAPPPFTPKAGPATISFLNYSTGQHVRAQSVELAFEVQSTGDPAVRLMQNDRRLGLEAAHRNVTINGELRSERYQLTVQLQEGENHFQVIALTDQRSLRLLSLIREVEKGRLWVVAIGVSDYADQSIQALDFGAADARAVHDYFRDAFNLPPNQLFLRTDKEATQQEIRGLLGTRLKDLASSPDDTVVIYFAGHGAVERVPASSNADGLDKYLLLYDTRLVDLFGTALRTDEIPDILQRLRAERVIVLLDSCFSGGAAAQTRVVRRKTGERTSLTGDFLDRMVEAGRGRVVVTASGPNEAAKESSELKHGVFTYYLLQALRGAAGSDPDGAIYLDEVYRYLSEKVPGATSNQQHPERKAPTTSGRILIGQASSAIRLSP